MCKGTIKVFCIVVLIIAVLLSQGCGRKQQVNISYSFAISPRKGEVLRGVTVYLPFPMHEGKPVKQLLKSLQKDYEKYYAKDFPNAKIFIAKTKHRDMLGVKVPIIDHRGFGLEGGFGYKQDHSEKPVAPEYKLNPVSKRRKGISHEIFYLSDSKIYVACKGSEKIQIANRYQIQILSPSILPLDYVPEDRYEAFLGFTSPPKEMKSLVHVFPTTGWINTTIMDYGYDRSNS